MITQVDLLRRRAEARSPVGAAVVFPTSTGQLRNPNNTSGALRKALDRAGFDWVTSHVLRRTVATRHAGSPPQGARDRALPRGTPVTPPPR